MWLPRIMHEQTDLLNSICKIRRVKVRYCKAPARLLYSEALATGAPSVADNLDLESTGVDTGWQSLIPAR
jgi:hypothetical protein